MHHVRRICLPSSKAIVFQRSNWLGHLEGKLALKEYYWSKVIHAKHCQAMTTQYQKSDLSQKWSLPFKAMRCFLAESAQIEIG